MISVPVQSSKKIGIAACSSLNPVEQFGGNPSPGANTNDNRKRADHPTWPTCNREFSAISKDRHYVLGNHCVDTLTKDEFLGGVEQPKSYYSFDRGGFHFVILDACFRGDGQSYGRKNSKWNDANIPAAEMEWLEADLKSNDKQVIVFAHQRLDVSTDHGVKNCSEVRRILEASGKVRVVFQGHSHQNDLKDITGIHYLTMVAMVEGSGVENNGYSLMEIARSGTISIKGFRKQKTHEWS